MNNLSPDTTLALMNATQGDTARISKNLEASRQAKNLQKINDAAHEFEAVFMSEMMKPMFEGLSTDGMFSGGKGEEIFRGMLLQEYGKMLSQTGSVGIADQVKAEMIRMQGAINADELDADEIPTLEYTEINDNSANTAVSNQTQNGEMTNVE